MNRHSRALFTLFFAGLLAACGGAESSGPDSSDAPADDGPTSAGDEAPAPPGDAPSEMRALLDGHNEARAEHCAAPLTWSDEVAASADAWAQRLAADGCGLEHGETAYGENLFAGSSGMTPDDVVGAWVSERDAYSFGDGGFSMDTGHFTQVVWRESARLGCARAACDGMEVWVCQYDPPGNYEGQYAEQVLPTSCR